MSQSHVTPGRDATYSTPRWVKVFMIIFIVLVLVVVIGVVTGHAGPGIHMSPIEHGMQHP